MACAKFEGNRFRIDGEIAENHAILVDLMASIVTTVTLTTVTTVTRSLQESSKCLSSRC